MSASEDTSLHQSDNLGGERESLYHSCPTPRVFDKEAVQSLPRHYIITQLKDNGFTDLADALSEVPNPDDPIHEALSKVASTLNEERQEQFDDMINTLALNDSNLKESYDSIVEELLKEQTNWGRIVTFIVFASHIVLYCAQKRELKHRVPDVVEWTESVTEKKLLHWIEQQGGWQAFMEHYDLENWRISLSTALLGLGVGISALAGGIALCRKFLF